MSEIILANDRGIAIVDESDYDWLSKFKWAWRDGYAVTSRFGDNKTMGMHRLILNANDGYLVDHVDRNKLNNTRKNLRLCDSSQNAANKIAQEGSRSRFKGVYFDITRDKWRSQIYIGGKNKHLGYFTSEEDAAIAYNMAAPSVFGEFARLNYV